MKQVLTVACKIKVMPEQLAKEQETFPAFVDACEYVSQEVPEKLTNELAMQSLVYHEVRARFATHQNRTEMIEFVGVLPVAAIPDLQSGKE